MKQLVIRNIDDAVIEALRRRAAACGTSTEECFNILWKLVPPGLLGRDDSRGARAALEAGVPIQLLPAPVYVSATQDIAIDLGETVYGRCI
ncbi:MAG TPA: hypothetical protein VGG57_15245 [Stellaceae bacterium]|jgi:plasmid stability protein